MATAQAERTAHLRAWRASGQSTARYGLEHGISQSTLFRWAREEAGRRQVLRFLPVVVEPGVPSALAVHVGGARIEVKAGFDAKLLREVVAALRGEG